MDFDEILWRLDFGGDPDHYPDKGLVDSDHNRDPGTFLRILYYLCQVNEVNGGDNAFVRCMSVCVCVCVRSGRSWKLNANSSKTVKATDFKFGTSVPRDSPDMTAKNLSKWGAWLGSRDPLNFSALNANTWRRYALS